MARHVLHHLYPRRHELTAASRRGSATHQRFSVRALPGLQSNALSLRP